MTLRAGLHNFSRGAISEELWGRIDVDAYNAAVKQAVNVVVLKYGGLQKRPGTHLVYEIKDGPKRLIPFEYSLDFTYALLFGQGNMRPATGGGVVLETKLKVTAATRTDPVQITAAFHGYSDGDEVYFTDGEIEGMTELNGRFATVTVIDEDNFTVNIDGTDFGAFTGDSGGITNSAPPPAPPAPPAVPDPVPPPDPPDIGGGGHGTPIGTGPLP